MSKGPDTVADTYLRALSDQGVQWLFCNAGTDFPPLIEAFERGAGPMPLPVLVPHENVAVAMAYGAAAVTGRPQVVMVHVGLGTANALCGLMNASRQRIPLILTAGRTPVLEGGRFGARNNYINWAQEMFDQAGMLREFVKWDYELRDPAQVEAVVNRAFSLVESSPPGPAYLVLPREVLSAPALPPALPVRQSRPAKAARPDAEALRQVAECLARAKRPLIVTADAGRDAKAFWALDQFAEAWSIPVVQYRPRHASLRTGNPMFCGFDPAPLMTDADCLIVLECDVPWLPDQNEPPVSCQVVQVGEDPLCSAYPMRSFASDLTMQCDAAAFLTELDTALRQSGGLGPQLQAQRQQRVRTFQSERRPPPAVEGLNHRYVSKVLAEYFDEDTVLINEYPFALEELTVTRPGHFFTLSQAGGLGWGLGMALGVKLASPESFVVAALGDGCYMFGNPTPAHFVARSMNLPFLTVIFNNRRWAAVHRATLSMYPDGRAAHSTQPVLSSLEPAPDYEQVVTASGGFAARVERVDQLRDVLRQAVEAVRQGRQAVVNVLTDADYVRTS
ncbi:MAG: thiamine pyrophosphate-requiring protein [Pigmentiphaga sp.]